MTHVRTWGVATLLVAGLLTVLGLPLTGSSSATFTGQSRSTATVGSAADWTAPTVTMTDPGAVLRGTATVAAQASDGESGIASVAIQYLRSGTAGWTTICTDTTTPYSCAWNSEGVDDGTYSLRAVATDQAGYETVSGTVSTTIANSMSVVLGEPGDAVRGTVPLSVTLLNPGILVWSVRVEYVESGGTAWKAACAYDSVAPYTCSWNSTGLANGDYDLRAVATFVGLANRYSAVEEVTVDNQAPTVAVTDPGTPLRGTVGLTATASDAHAGITQLVLQHQRSGTSGWTDVCTTTEEPYRCPLDTTRLTDGSYSFRAIATDGAGNTTTSAPVANRMVDNTVSSVSLDDPGAELAGTVALQARANSTAGVSKVVIQRAPNGGAAWTDVCTVAAAPYTCSWNTTTVANGLHDLRAVLTDGSGKSTTSSVVTARRVDNSPLRGTDVQATNGGGTAGRLEAGDTITFGYSRAVQLSTVTSGWNGAALPVTVRLRDGAALGLGSTGDSLDVQRTGGSVNLGLVNLRGDYIKAGKTATFNATMTATTVTVDGVPQTRVTITVGTLAVGKDLRTVSKTAAMTWAPSAAVLDTSGNACATTTVTESGALDREF
ncbi:MAG TPA: Ig-like domain-containing protein [Nocardioides sp.]|nr:Ig-like domain-containing protein [Nocardioides sp.]